MNGHEDHPVSCRAKHCTNGGVERDMVRARAVLGRENARGWFCQGCAGNGGRRVMAMEPHPGTQGCPHTLNGQPCILHPRNGHREHVSLDLEVWV
jgi:hypothetical protein